MKILFIHPPVRLQGVPEDLPFGLAMLAAIAEQEGHQVAILDLNANRVSLQTVAEEIAIDDYDVIGIGGLSSQYKDITRILPICRQIHPDALILAGGGFATYMPDKILQVQSEIDIVCIGEGEETFKEILQTASSGDFSKVKGIAYRDNEGKIIFTEPRALISDMDTLPYPAYHLLDLETYFKYSSIVHSKESLGAKRRIDIITQRGCPRQCTFCTHNGMSRWDQINFIGKSEVKKLDDEVGFQQISRFNSPRYVVDQIKHVYEKYNIDYCYILDENLTSNKKVLTEMCNLMIKEGLHKKIHWGTAGDSASVTDELIKLMKESGCTFISYGGESASDKVLKYDIQKGTTKQHNQNAIDIMKRQGMEPVMTFMIGNPNEDINDILETTEFFIKNNMLIKPFICTPYPGTKLFLDYEDMVLAQFDERLAQLKDYPERIVSEKIIKKWKMGALKKFLISLDDADVLSAYVSQVFSAGDLLALQSLMTSQDMNGILKLAHERKWEHDEKWIGYCSVCQAKDYLENMLKVTA